MKGGKEKEKVEKRLRNTQGIQKKYMYMTNKYLHKSLLFTIGIET